jgi:hypothetical protein
MFQSFKVKIEFGGGWSERITSAFSLLWKPSRHAAGTIGAAFA